MTIVGSKVPTKDAGGAARRGKQMGRLPPPGKSIQFSL